jgi:hypothetical protein
VLQPNTKELMEEKSLAYIHPPFNKQTEEKKNNNKTNKHENSI